MNDPQRSGSMWPGFFAGLIGLPVLVVAVLATGIAASLGEVAVVVGGIVVVAAILLVTRPDPFQRGLGAGMLVAMALAPIVLIGLCFAMIDNY